MVSATFRCTRKIHLVEQGMAEKIKDTIRAHMRSQFGLSEAQIDAMLPSFMNTLAGYLRELGSHFSAGDQDGVSRVAHTTKGALLNLGLNDQAALAKEIEQGAKAGAPLVDLEPDFKEMRAGLESLLD